MCMKIVFTKSLWICGRKLLVKYLHSLLIVKSDGASWLIIMQAAIKTLGHWIAEARLWSVAC